ncbi:Casein kinase II subunit alpha' [Bienertia sinuspersici]
MHQSELMGMRTSFVRKVYEAMIQHDERLAVKKRLPIIDRLSRWGVNESVCVLCSTQTEDTDHLFFKCSYSMDIL